MELVLDGNKYGFVSDKRSSLTFEITGACLFIQCDFFLGFGDENKYFTILVSMDPGVIGQSGIVAGLWLYPSSGNTLQSGMVTEILNTSLSIQDALAAGNRSNLHLWSNETDAIWPIEIKIINDYRINEINLAFSNGNRSASCSFGDVFTPNTDLHFTITSDYWKHGEGIEIYDIAISQDDGKITAADKDLLVDVVTSTSTVIDTSAPFWILDSSKDTTPPAW